MHFLLELYHNCNLCAHVSNASLEAEESSMFPKKTWYSYSLLLFLPCNEMCLFV